MKRILLIAAGMLVLGGCCFDREEGHRWHPHFYHPDHRDHDRHWFRAEPVVVGSGTGTTPFDGTPRLNPNSCGSACRCAK